MGIKLTSHALEQHGTTSLSRIWQEILLGPHSNIFADLFVSEHNNSWMLSVLAAGVHMCTFSRAILPLAIGSDCLWPAGE